VWELELAKLGSKRTLELGGYRCALNLDTSNLFLLFYESMLRWMLKLESEESLEKLEKGFVRKVTKGTASDFTVLPVPQM